MEKKMTIEPAVINITLDDLFQAQGADYTKRTIRPQVLELNRRILEEAAGLVKPRLIYKEVQVTGANEPELLLEGGIKLTSKLLTRVASTAEKLILLAMTIGSALDERIAEYSKAGQTLEAFTLDAAGSAFLAKSSMAVFDQLEISYKGEGLSTTFPLGPGHSYWNGLDDLRTIVRFLEAEQIGISLTESNLMLPKKTLAFVMGVGRNLPDFTGKNHCDFCSLKNTCNMSKMGRSCS